MAGNIVKWWRHKILGGYKQFSVLQECQTDSEELIYQARAPSSCSAPPDLLITSDPDSKIMKNHGCKSPKNGLRHQKPSSPEKRTYRKENHENSNSSEDRVRLEEFTCDVSLEDDSKQQPLQFSFTLYDLDGHGKITKDDIAGIVSTIYESIGKSVVVPHYGSKTINVRLTVSPDSKTRSHVNGKNRKNEDAPRRRCGRPRKLLSDDEEEDENCSDTSNEKVKREKNRLSKDCSTTTTATTATDSANENRDNKTRICFNDTNDRYKNKLTNIKHTSRHEEIYENVNNLKCNSGKTDEDYLIDMNSCHNDDFGKHNDNDNCNIICKECPVQTCPFDLAVHKSNKRKMLRKSRSRKTKNLNGSENVKPRARSLSVGHENTWKMDNRNDEQQCWKSPLKRHELIEIIRESMEKNRLCFQTNRKSIETPVKHRNRSNTVTTKVIDAINQANSPKHVTNSHHESNLCGYDSFLHATICTNAKNGVHLSASPMVITGPNRLTHHHKNRLRTKHHTNAIASYHQINQHPSRETAPMKLSTSLLNQLNPNLSAEQKMNRSINQVELWLETKDIRGQNNDIKIMKNTLDNAVETKCLNNNPNQVLNVNNNQIRNDKTQKSIKCLNNSDFTEQLKITEDDLVELNTIVSPKKTFNKEVLIATRKQIKTHVQESPETPNNQRTVLEYASIPIVADPGECENLLNDDELPTAVQNNEQPTADSTTTSNTTPSTVHRYVHIHHHYHHFDAEEEE